LPLFCRERGESGFLPLPQVFFGQRHYPDYSFLNLFNEWAAVLSSNLIFMVLVYRTQQFEGFFQQGNAIIGFFKNNGTL
jgi:hypothetical protein